MTGMRRAFTLLEVMVALTVTALALTSAGVAVGAARSTAARVARHTQHTEADGRVRTLLTDMLRHAPSADQIDGALLEIDGTGRAPVLRFVSTGVRAPFGTGPLWQVELSLADSVLTVRATPLSRGATDQPLVATLSPVNMFAVRTLTHSSGTDAAAWRTDWPLAQDRPRAVELQWRYAGASVAAPLRVVLSPLEAPR
jgi:prepilin-type N-terminal cleavage/methylation domain-containing protein